MGMLTPGNVQYLLTLSDTEPVKVQPFNPAVSAVALSIVSELKTLLPTARVVYFGASALGLSGENDIDIGIIDEAEFRSGAPHLTNAYGASTNYDEKNSAMFWDFMRGGFAVQIFLTDELVGRQLEHIENHERLAADPSLRTEYEHLKLASEGVSKREYMKRKMEFLNALAHPDTK